MLILFFLTSTQGRASSDTLRLKDAVNRLMVLGDSLLKGSNDSIRTEANEHFSALLDSVLQSAGGTELSFGQVRALSHARAENQKVRALTWLLQRERGNRYDYFGYLILQPDPKLPARVIRLNQNKDLAREDLDFIKSDPSNWLGCIYYAIHVERYKKKDHYLLLGWAPQSTFTTRKLVEPLQFNTTKVSLGLAVIKAGGKTRHRMVFEYNAQATMSLRYHEKEKMIVMDHLSSSDPRPEARGMYQLYGPDLSYDGLKFSKGNWLLLKDIDIRNK